MEDDGGDHQSEEIQGKSRELCLGNVARRQRSQFPNYVSSYPHVSNLKRLKKENITEVSLVLRRISLELQSLGH